MPSAELQEFNGVAAGKEVHGQCGSANGGGWMNLMLQRVALQLPSLNNVYPKMLERSVTHGRFG